MPYRYHYPTPRPEAVAKARQIVLSKYGRELSENEARELLSRIMQFLYLSAHPEDQPPREEPEPESTNPSVA